LSEFVINQATTDLLREIGNIGAAHAATALSQMIGEPVNMRVPWVELVPFDDVTAVLGGPEQVVACVYLTVRGDITGSMFFVQSVPAAKILISELLSDVTPGDSFSELELSALAEMGNIMSATYLSSLIDLTNLQMQPSVPMVAVDMAQAVLAVGLSQDALVGNYALVIHATIHHLRASEDAHFFLLPDPGAERRLLTALGMGSAQ